MYEFEKLTNEDKEQVLGLSVHYARLSELPYDDKFRTSRLSYSTTDPKKSFEAATNTKEWTIRSIDEHANKTSYAALKHITATPWYAEDLKTTAGLVMEYKNNPFVLIRNIHPTGDKVAVYNLNMIMSHSAQKYHLQPSIQHYANITKTLKVTGVFALGIYALSRVL